LAVHWRWSIVKNESKGIVYVADEWYSSDRNEDSMTHTELAAFTTSNPRARVRDEITGLTMTAELALARSTRFTVKAVAI
jgi:hypothetical protein